MSSKDIELLKEWTKDKSTNILNLITDNTGLNWQFNGYWDDEDRQIKMKNISAMYWLCPEKEKYMWVDLNSNLKSLDIYEATKNYEKYVNCMRIVKDL